MTTLSSYQPTHRALIVGLPKSGKTTLAGELSKSFNLIWFDIESGAEALKKLPIQQQQRINLISVRDSATYPVAAETIMQLWKYQKGSVCIAHSKYNCADCVKNSAPVEVIDFTSLGAGDIVVLDTITQIGASVLAHLVRNQPVTYKPERDDWGGLRKHTEHMASQWQASKFNLICIAHAVEAELEDGRKKLVPAFGSAGMSASVAAKFSDVIYCEVKNGKHVAYSSSIYSNSILTGSRSGFEIEKLKEPSLLPLFQNETTFTDISIENNINVGIKMEEIKKDNPTVSTPATRSLSNLRNLVKK